MFKKLLSTFLTVTLLMSFATTALAAKKDDGGASTGKANDIFAIWGDFEHPNAISKIGRYSTGTQKIVAGGVDGSKNCLELSDCTTTWSDVIIEIGAVPGEIYNVSFYVKRGTETPTGIKAHLIKQG